MGDAFSPEPDLTTVLGTAVHDDLIDPVEGFEREAHTEGSLGHRHVAVTEQIDTVFLTNFRPAHRGGLSLFSHAKTYVHELEQQAFRERLDPILKELAEDDEDRLRLEQELAILDACLPAPDKLAPGIDLFPLFGYTAGTCGLLLSLPTLTVLIAGDAVPTQEHFLAGQVLPDPQNLTAAKEALQEVYDIADVIVPGHDNVFANPRAAGL